MESPETTADRYSGLMSSILELTREIENLDEDPTKNHQKKVLWAKKRFPRQGIRCVGKTRAARRKYIGATARDYPWRILRKAADTGPPEHSTVPPQALSETFQREGSAETLQGTESLSSDPYQRSKNVSRGAQTSETKQVRDENSSAIDGDGHRTSNSVQGVFINIENLPALIEGNKTWKNESNSFVDDDSSIRAMNITNDERDDDEQSVESPEFDENSEALGEILPAVEDDCSQDDEFENMEHFVAFTDSDDANSSNNTTIRRSPEDGSSYTTKDVRGEKREAPKKARAPKKLKVTVPGYLFAAASSSRGSGSAGEKSRRKLSSRAKKTVAQGSKGCPRGKRCLGCGDSVKSEQREEKLLPGVMLCSDLSNLAMTGTNSVHPAIAIWNSSSLAIASSESTCPQLVGSESSLLEIPDVVSSRSEAQDPQTPRAASATPETPNSAKAWTKKDWNDFYDVFTAVSAEVRTLRSMGFNNTRANKRWLECMRRILQKPPF